MASLVQRLSRSFMTTLFYIWTVIQALLSIRRGSSVPFPFRETSAVVPCPVEIDLENGVTVQRERRAYPMPAPLTASSTPRTSQEVIQKTANVHSNWQQQDRLTSSPSFSSGSSPSPFCQPDSEFTGINLSASIVEARLPASESPDALKKTTEEGTNYHFDLSLADNLTMDPFLDVKPISSLVTYPFKDGCAMEDIEPVLFTLPLCTSTPPRSRRGRGHRRGAFAANTKPEHIKASKFSIEPDLLPSLMDTEFAIGTPSAWRQRTASLRRSVGFGIFDSPLPAWYTPKRPAPSIVVLSSTPESSSSSEPVFDPTTPLRIVKRNKVRYSTTSEVSKSVISAVRDAFVEAREEHEGDAAADPRDLLSRASVWTCNTLLVGCSKTDISVYEDDETADENTQESGEHEPATPPPPYAFSNFNATDIVTDGLKAETVKVFLDMKRWSVVSSDGSTDLGYLATAPGSVPASVDSCLDDILASFENLMTVMPDFHPSLTKAQAVKFNDQVRTRIH